MKELRQMVEAWQQAKRDGEEAILATVVDVSGSSYRQPGGRLLLTSTGKRVGAISGGCLEGDLQKKAWWLTEEGRSVVRLYDTSADADGPIEFGLGCNGVIHVLIERLRPGKEALPLRAIERSNELRRAAALATVIRSNDPDLIGTRVAILPDGELLRTVDDNHLGNWLEAEARRALDAGSSCITKGKLPFGDVDAFVELIEPPLHLWIFGAGDDAMAVVDQAKLLGWRVSVLDGRSHYARQDRFPNADLVLTNTLEDPLAGLVADRWTVAVVMAHSVSQDTAVLKELVRHQLSYVGVLGPQRRTKWLLDEAGLAEAAAVQQWHSPVGLDLGGDGPEQVALAIVAEAHAVSSGRAGGKLQDRGGPIHLTNEPRPETPFVVNTIVCA
ncbi:MAG: XdhC family protein [Bryobacteraceae bacterium]